MGKYYFWLFYTGTSVYEIAWQQEKKGLSSLFHEFCMSFVVYISQFLLFISIRSGSIINF